MSQSPPTPPDRRRRFTGHEASPLDLRTAAEWTATERRRHPQEVRAYFFGRRILERILAQPGCMGLRVHYATDPATGQRHLLIVGADADQNDQLPRLRAPRQLAAEADEADAPDALRLERREAIIAEMAIPCPNQCGDANLLNGGRAE